MFLLRALFWLGLVAYLVPYKTVDSANASFIIDAHALATRAAALPRYCDRHGEACRAAHALIRAVGAEGEAALQLLR